MKCFGLIIAAVGLLASGARQAPAGTFTAFTQNTTFSGQGYNVGTNEVRGWAFTANTGFLVKQLGYFDSTIDSGLLNAHDIGIWDFAGNLLTSTTVPAGGAATLLDVFRYVDTTPVLLQGGQSYVIGAVIHAGLHDDQVLIYNSAASLAFNSAVTFIEGRYRTNSPTLQYPDGSERRDFVIDISANFRADTAATQAVPEPASLAIWTVVAGIGVFGRGLRRRRYPPRPS